MSIIDRIDKARKDYLNRDYDNALIQALIAVAATSKKRYPKLGDKKAFIQFLQDDFLKKIQPNISITGGFFEVFYKGKMVGIEELLYKHVRCKLFHEAGFPREIIFDQPATGFTISLRNNKLYLGQGVIEILIRIVVEAPENKFYD